MFVYLSRHCHVSEFFIAMLVRPSVIHHFSSFILSYRRKYANYAAECQNSVDLSQKFYVVCGNVSHHISGISCGLSAVVNKSLIECVLFQNLTNVDRSFWS